MKGHDIVLTEDDLEPRNILVQGLKAVAVLDWELSGYYPEYRDYCRVMWRPDWESKWVHDRALEKIIKPYRKELSIIWKTTEIIWCNSNVAIHARFFPVTYLATPSPAYSE